MDIWFIQSIFPVEVEIWLPVDIASMTFKIRARDFCHNIWCVHISSKPIWIDYSSYNDSLTTWKEMITCFFKISQARFCKLRMIPKLSRKILVGDESFEGTLQPRQCHIYRRFWASSITVRRPENSDEYVLEAMLS